MSSGANVHNIDAIKIFRAALIKFAETGNVALTSADSDVDRVLGWLERDQTSYWQGQLRKRHEFVLRCEDAVRQKQLFKGVDGRPQSAVDEIKALNAAKRKREEAEQKQVAVKKAIQTLRKEAMMYKGRVQKFATLLSSDIPNAVRQLDTMLDHLDTYLSIQTAGEGVALGDSTEQISRAAASTRVGLEALRDRTPKPEIRQSAPLTAIPVDHAIRQRWAVGHLEDWHLKALAGLGIAPAMPEPDQTIVIAPDVWAAKKVYLERLDPTSESDGGWYIGPATDPVVEVASPIAVRVGDLMAARPDWSALLSMPAGTLVILDAGGPTAMFDPLGLDIWSIALIKAAAPPEPTPPPTEDKPHGT